MSASGTRKDVSEMGIPIPNGGLMNGAQQNAAQSNTGLASLGSAVQSLVATGATPYTYSATYGGYSPTTHYIHYPSGEICPVGHPNYATLAAQLKQVEPRKVTARMPDYVQPIKAWRAWGMKVGIPTMQLASVGIPGVWEPKKMMEAQCRAWPNNRYTADQTPVHPAPHKECDCGLWAFRDIDTLVKHLSEYPDIKVLGEVALWGRIIECENGYRAQYGYPTELWLLDPDLEQLGFAYGVPIRSIPNSEPR